MATSIGLDIGTSAVRAVQLSTSRKADPTLDKLGQVLLPQGAVRDGEIVQPEVVTDALRTLWKTYGFKGRKVHLGLANQQVVVRQVDLPYLPEDELRRSLAFQAQDYIPIPVDQAVLDFHIIESFELEGGQRVSRLLLIAAAKAMVQSMLDVVVAAKLDVVGVDLDAFAVLRALTGEEAVPTGEGQLIIDVGASVTNLVVHDNGVPRFVRILLMGGGGITEALVSELDLSYEEAEDAKATIGITFDEFQTLEDEQARLIAERAQRFVEEIRGSVDYYVAQTDSVVVRSALLTGGASRLPNLRERLAEVLHLPVDYGEPIGRVQLGKVGLDEEQLVQAEPFLTVALGLAQQGTA